MAMGPFRMSDLAGNDIGWSIRKRRYAERPEMPRALLADRLCEQGRFGQKAGAGWYRYEPGRREALPDPAVDALIEAFRREANLVPRPIADDEIVDRCIFALADEGAAILKEGIAARASDIDVVYLAGYGFPPYRGGPMFYARHGRALHGRAHHEGVRGERWRRPCLLDPGSAAFPPGRRGRLLQRTMRRRISLEPDL